MVSELKSETKQQQQTPKTKFKQISAWRMWFWRDMRYQLDTKLQLYLKLDCITLPLKPGIPFYFSDTNIRQKFYKVII